MALCKRCGSDLAVDERYLCDWCDGEVGDDDDDEVC
jgi:uncharacterized membrane protein YvbJ